MTKRLYHANVYATEFIARVISRIPLPQYPGCEGIVLDQTYFYPTSGGQPHDTGRIAGRSVVDVWVEPDGRTIVHAVAGSPEQDEVRAEIDWVRRFDHMQQHTGQHIISRAFMQVAQAATVGFHLGSRSTTIDLDVGDLSESQLSESELSANQVVWQNRRVRDYQVTPAEAAQLDLRKLPPNHAGPVRVVEIEDFDRVACGGTHVSRTGEVGQIKIIALEKRGRECRIHFLCGKRALLDYDARIQVIARLTSLFTTGFEELPRVAQNQRDELKLLQRQLRHQRSRLLQFEASELLAGGTRQDGVTIVTRVFEERDTGELRELGRILADNAGVAALLGLAGRRSYLLFCRSADVHVDMSGLLSPAMKHLGLQSGGGGAALAQSGGPAVDSDRMAKALAAAEQQLGVLLAEPLPASDS